jgi:hypothetical protein
VIQEEFQFIGDFLQNKAKIEKEDIVYYVIVLNHKGIYIYFIIKI